MLFHTTGKAYSGGSYVKIDYLWLYVHSNLLCIVGILVHNILNGPVPTSALHLNVFLEVHTCVTVRKCALRGASVKGSEALRAELEQAWTSHLPTSLLLGSPRRQKMALTMVALFAALLLKVIRNHSQWIIWKIRNWKKRSFLTRIQTPMLLPDRRVNTRYNNNSMTYILAGGHAQLPFTFQITH